MRDFPMRIVPLTLREREMHHLIAVINEENRHREIGLDEPVMYIAAIKLPPGKLAAQVAHAAVMLYAFGGRNSSKRSTIWNAWLDSGQAKVVLRLQGSPDDLLAKLTDQIVPFVAVHDAGRTVCEPGTLTAVAIGPVLRSEPGPWRSMKLY